MDIHKSSSSIHYEDKDMLILVREEPDGVEKIYADMERLVDEYIAAWKLEHPDVEAPDEILLDEEEVLGNVLRSIE